MITIKIRDWVTIGGVTHIATDYQVASDPSFTNILDNHPNDAQNLTVYYSPVVIPLNATYYIRSRRRFSNNTIGSWGDTVAITNTQNNGGVIAYTKIKVNQPIVTVDKVSLSDHAVGTYTVTTSQFNGVGEGHGYTIWSVLNDKNEVIEYVKTTTGLTSITFNKFNANGTHRLAGTKHIRVIAIHGTLTNIESSPGETTINLSTANFTLSTVNKIVQSGVNLTVSVNSIPNTLNNQASKIDLTDINGNVIYTAPVLPNTSSVVIPGSELLPGMNYELVGYGVPATIDNRYTLAIETQPSIIVGMDRPTYTYTKTIKRDANLGVYPKQGSVRGVSLDNGTTITSILGGLGKVYQNQDGTYTYGGRFTNAGFTAANSSSIYLRMLDNNRMLCSGLANGANKSTLYVFNIDYYNNTETTSVAFTVNGDSLGSNNGVVFTTPNVFYGAHHNGILRRYEITSTSILWKDIPLPTGAGALATITKDVGGNILVYCKNSSVIYSYNPTTAIYTKKYTLPLVFRGRALKQEELVNGDALVWNFFNTEVVNGVSVTDAVIELLYVDNKNGTVTHIPSIARGNYNINGSIVTQDGKVLLLTTETTGSNIIVFA